MKQPELTPEESEVYLKIVKQGNMDDMFEFGYVIGRSRLAKERLDYLEGRPAAFQIQTLDDVKEIKN
jgi:hypothetical protein